MDNIWVTCRIHVDDNRMTYRRHDVVYIWVHLILGNMCMACGLNLDDMQKIHACGCKDSLGTSL